MTKEKCYSGLQAEYDEVYEKLSLEFEEIEKARELEGTITEEEFISQTSSYFQLLQEFEGADKSEVEDLNLLKEMSIAGSLVTAIPEKGKEYDFKHHVIIQLDEDNPELLGKTVHEILHALESTKEVKEGKVYGKSGFTREDDNYEARLLSEVIHCIILDSKIFPLLEKKGYEISDLNDYYLKMLPMIRKFYTKFESAILDARCAPNLDNLYSIIGKENFLRLVQLQNNSKTVTEEQMLAIISEMEEHSRQNLANRIGQFTLPQQKDVVSKEATRKSFQNEIEKYQQKAGKEYDE